MVYMLLIRFCKCSCFVSTSELFVFISEISVAPQLWCNCLTAVVQLPHNCGATAPQLWGNDYSP